MLKQNNNNMDDLDLFLENSNKLDDLDLDLFLENSSKVNHVASPKESTLAFATEKNGFNKQQVMSYITSLRNEYQKITDQYMRISSQTQNIITKNQSIVNENNQLRTTLQAKAEEIASLQQQKKEQPRGEEDSVKIAQALIDARNYAAVIKTNAERERSAILERTNQEVASIQNSGKLVMETLKSLQNIISDAVAKSENRGLDNY